MKKIIIAILPVIMTVACTKSPEPYFLPVDESDWRFSDGKVNCEGTYVVNMRGELEEGWEKRGGGFTITTLRNATDASEAVVYLSEDWCSITSQGNAFIIDVKPNLSFEERTCEISIKYRSAEFSYTLVQQSNTCNISFWDHYDDIDFVTWSRRDTLDFTCFAGEKSVDMMSNVDGSYEVLVPENAKDWITPKVETKSATGNGIGITPKGVLSFRISENNDCDDRMAEITVLYPDSQAGGKLVIRQQGRGFYLEVCEDEIPWKQPYVTVRSDSPIASANRIVNDEMIPAKVTLERTESSANGEMFVYRVSVPINNNYKSSVQRKLQITCEGFERYPINAVVSQSGNPTKYGAVDLGLSVLWADRNYNASSPHRSGTSVYWGDNTGEAESTRYESEGEWVPGPFDEGHSISGDPDYDIFANLVGGGWRMPTKEEWEELVSELSDKGKYTWSTIKYDDGYWGWKATGVSNDNEIIFNGNNSGSYERYWTATFYGTSAGSSLRVNDYSAYFVHFCKSISEVMPLRYAAGYYSYGAYWVCTRAMIRAVMDY